MHSSAARSWIVVGIMLLLCSAMASAAVRNSGASVSLDVRVEKFLNAMQYFKDLDPKLATGGCFTAHNASNAFAGIKVFLDYVRSRPEYRTTIDRSSSSGISISYKDK